MLKKYGVKHIVASPGMQNAKFNSIVQEDESFTCYSVVDERSAGYFATGIYNETKMPVVITCTGATASRNYLSALTESYYRKIPIIAITFYNYTHTPYSLSAQYVDRSSLQNDVVYESVDIPRITDAVSKEKALALLNAVLYKAFYKGLPVHINCPSSFEFKENDFSLCEDIWSPQYYSSDFVDLKAELKDKDFAVFVGCHKSFSNEETRAISEFVKSYDVPVICDHTSNYKGENKVLTSVFVNRLGLEKFPSLIIDMGGISGEYSSSVLFKKNNPKIWRISETGEFQCRLSQSVEKIFDCKETYFFNSLFLEKNIENGYYSKIKLQMDNLSDSTELPLCNGLVCQSLAKYIPNNSSLHLAILNSLRCMNYFELNNSIDVTCNVGGFGIDGALSTVVGQSVVDKDKMNFAVVGDLAFFYDMNALGLRHLSKNLRIIVVNNNRGEEFRINPVLENNLGEKTDELIAAGGHYKSGAKQWAKSCGFEYLEATSKSEFLSQIEGFCLRSFEKPVLFEVFVENIDEQNGLALLANKK